MATRHPRGLPRLALDRSLQLFENMFHAGAHEVGGGGRLAHRGVGTPLVLHFNGPAKVVFEKAWGLEAQWDATAGKTPVLHLLEGLRRAHDAPSRSAALAAFETNVTFLDTWLQRAPGIGPLGFTCEVPAA